jgi:hypothetical protein
MQSHHLLKTFWSGTDGWRDEQFPDGKVVWTSPTGQTYTTWPGSRLLFPALCIDRAKYLLSQGKSASSVTAGS